MSKHVSIPIPRSHTLLSLLIALCILLLSLLLPAPFPANGATNQVYLPNITKTLGGDSGWTTPIVVQNTGTDATDITLTLYRFSDGSLADTVKAAAIKPGQSWQFDPRSDAKLPNDMQFSAVVEAANGQAAAIVLEGAGSSWMTYRGTSVGASTVYLPNITRNLGGTAGWNTPFIVQNIGAKAVTATVSFYTFATGALAKRIENVQLQPGRSRAFLTWAIEGLADDAQYAVVIEGPADAQLYAIVNESSGAMAMSYEGILTGSDVVYLPNVLKYLGGRDHWSTPFIVQNMGANPTTLTLEFYSFESGQLVTSHGPIVLMPGRSLPVDVRFTPITLPAGSYSVVIRGAQGSKLGAVVNETDEAAGMAMSYNGIARTQSLPSAYLPIVQKNNGEPRWVSPVIAQNLGTSASDITITLFDQAGVIAAQKVFPTVKPGAAAVYDPRFDRRLKNGTYSALVQAAANVSAVVNVSGSLRGDYAMAFTSVAGPQTNSPFLSPVAKQVGAHSFVLRTGLQTDVYVDAAMPQADAVRAVAQADADVAQVQTEYARTFQAVPTIYLCASNDSYVAALTVLLGYSPQQATASAARTAAMFQPRAQLIVANWSVVGKNIPLSAMRHELAHLMNSQLIGTNPTLPTWLDEGLAENEELTLPGSRWIGMLARGRTASMAHAGRLFPLSELESPTLWSSRKGPAASYQYAEATVAVEFLRQDVGTAGIVRILELMGQGQTFKDAYGTVAGKTYAEFAAAFSARAQALFPTYPTIITTEDSPIGPGLSWIYFGFPPLAIATLEIRSSTIDSMFAEITDEYGTEWGFLGPSFPSGNYNLTVTAGGSTVSVIARRP